MDGFPYEYQELTVASVSDELVGPAEVRRYLGPGLGDALTVDGPLVAVEARLPASTFRVRSARLRLLPGMPGTARVRCARATAG